MNQQRETGKSVSLLGHSGRDWLSGLKWRRAQGSGCHLAEPQENTLAQSGCLNRRHQRPLPTNVENESQGGSLSKARQNPALPIFPVSKELPRQMTLQMQPPPFKTQLILFPFNLSLPPRSSIPLKKQNGLRLRIFYFPFCPGAHVCVAYFSLFHWLLIWLWSQSPSKSTAPRIWWWGHLYCVFGTEADTFSLKKDMKPGPSSSGSLFWHVLKLQDISNTSSHDFWVPCTGLEFQTFSEAVLVWMPIEELSENRPLSNSTASTGTRNNSDGDDGDKGSRGATDRRLPPPATSLSKEMRSVCPSVTLPPLTLVSPRLVDDVVPASTKLSQEVSLVNTSANTDTRKLKEGVSK